MPDQVKLVIYTPQPNANQIRQTLGQAGAGTIGEYTYCSYSVTGTGRFKPSNNANPHIGEPGKPEAVTEERIEVTCNKDQAPKIIELIKEVHPYEEVVIDVYPLLQL